METNIIDDNGDYYQGDCICLSNTFEQECPSNKYQLEQLGDRNLVEIKPKRREKRIPSE